MHIVDIITKKRNGEKLSKEEIKYLVKGYTDGTVPDYQMSAFLMAVWFRGMDKEETVCLTKEMAQSGDMMDLSRIHGIKVDKHSTGGVGDKTTLVVAPVVSALGIPVAKMSGRGLGHTGGTIDKLESIEGFRTDIPEEQFINNINKINIAIAGQTKNICPADKKIYALRDVTATVDNYSLIASSIMSKKLASGADAIVLDVKCGNGAFMHDTDSALKLAKTMTEIGNSAGKRTVALITDMNEPLGRMVGNSLEIIEAIEVLNGNGEERLTEVCIMLAANMLLVSDREEYFEDCHSDEERRTKATETVKSVIKSGAALKKLAELTKAQGGNPEYIYNTSLFKTAAYKIPVKYNNSGYLSYCDTEKVGKSSLILGAGREKKEDKINHYVGIEFLKKLGDYIGKDEILAYLYADDKEKAEEAESMILSAYEVSPEKPEKNKLIKGFVC